MSGMKTFARRVIVATIGGLAIAGGLGQGVAEAAWTNSAPISSDEWAAEPPAVASDPDGDTVVAWASNGIIQARARSAAGVLGAVQDLSAVGGHAKDPVVAMTDTGTAIIGWLRYD